MTLLVECASLRRSIEVAETQHLTPNSFSGKAGAGTHLNMAGELDRGCKVSELKELLEETVKRYEAIRLVNEQRLALPASVRFPFEDLVEQCRLSRFEQSVVWLLFFKAVSPDFRQKYEDSAINTVGHETNPELYIGNLLQILCPGSLRDQLEARKYFSVDAPLLRYHLVKLGRDVEDCATILEVELELPQRVIGWITEDNNTYVVDSPFHVECPETSLSQVVLPQEDIGRVLALIENHDAYVQKRRELRLDETISYGRAIVVLEYGPPGTGKTLLARALSNHTGRPLVSFNKRSGYGNGAHHSGFAENVPKLFREAQLRKGIVFIDECERFCMKDTEELGQLLIELERTDAIVIMATNRPEKLAPALDRRFTLKMPFQMPDAGERRRIWQVHIPKDVPLAGDVDVEQLARTYPFAGGYIKNAVLAAINLALSRSAGKEFILQQEDLEKAAKFQERHVGGACRYREIVTPKIGLDDALISETAREALRRLVSMARNYQRMMGKWSWNERLVSNPAKGIKVLFHGASLDPSLQAVEAMAGELGVSINRVMLHRILDEDDEPNKSKVVELFSAFSGTGHLLVFIDSRGILEHLEGLYDGAVWELFESLARYDGIAVVVSRVEWMRLPGWADVFHEQISFERPAQNLRMDCWRRVLNGSLPLAKDVDVEKLAQDYDLSLEEIQAAVHRACLLMAAVDPRGPLNAKLLERAICLVRKKSKHRECLFG
ncbi:MAG: ATP-binding protein [Deltaproteobacteria bacterium]|nr:ATP-binding protein [Deltaproteobacteria bacterium]MBW2122190.1 ATP-binding protein [Deltaproteobacteria bacterium]